MLVEFTARSSIAALRCDSRRMCEVVKVKLQAGEVVELPLECSGGVDNVDCGKPSQRDGSSLPRNNLDKATREFVGRNLRCPEMLGCGREEKAMTTDTCAEKGAAPSQACPGQ